MRMYIITFNNWHGLLFSRFIRQLFPPEVLSWILKLSSNGLYIHLDQEQSSIHIPFRSYLDIRDGQWHHLVAEWSNETQEVALYVNGVKDAVTAPWNVETLPV